MTHAQEKDKAAQIVYSGKRRILTHAKCQWMVFNDLWRMRTKGAKRVVGMSTAENPFSLPERFCNYAH